MARTAANVMWTALFSHGLQTFLSPTTCLWSTKAKNISTTNDGTSRKCCQGVLLILITCQSAPYTHPPHGMDSRAGNLELPLGWISHCCGPLHSHYTSAIMYRSPRSAKYCTPVHHSLMHGGKDTLEILWENVFDVPHHASSKAKVTRCHCNLQSYCKGCYY